MWPCCSAYVSVASDLIMWRCEELAPVSPGRWSKNTDPLRSYRRVCVWEREMMDCVSNDRPRYVPSAQCSIYTSSCCVCVVQVTTKAYFVCVCVCLYTSTPYKAWSSHSCNHKCTLQCSSCRTSWIFTALHTLLLTPAQRPPAWFITTHTGICGASPSIRQPVWAVTPRLQDAEASLSQERRRC